MQGSIKLILGLLLIITIQARGLPQIRKILIQNFVQNIPLDVLVHVQNIGDIVGTENQWVGTKGQSLRLQGFSIALDNQNQDRDGVYLQYMAHLQDIGDTPFVDEGTFIGTRGQSRRLQGFAIRLAGKHAQRYDVFYRAHLQDIGDTQVFRNGQFCGTRGQSRRVEAIFVTLIKKKVWNRRWFDWNI